MCSFPYTSTNFWTSASFPPYICINPSTWRFFSSLNTTFKKSRSATSRPFERLAACLVIASNEDSTGFEPALSSSPGAACVLNAPIDWDVATMVGNVTEGDQVDDRLGSFRRHGGHDGQSGGMQECEVADAQNGWWWCWLLQLLVVAVTWWM